MEFRRSALVPLASVAAMMVVAAVPAHASSESRARTREGFGLAYELRFAESLAVLDDARRADPADPAPARAIAAVTWMEILLSQGVATFAAFQGDASGDVVSRPPVPPDLAERFQTVGGEAVRLAERNARLAPDDLDAQYQLGASIGLMALYRGTVEGRTYAAFTEGRRAVGIMDRIRQKDPAHRESALIPGIYRYAVSTLSWPRRTLAAAAGLAGDRDGGIRLLEFAAAESAETGTDAAVVLMIVLNREARHGEATEYLRRLTAKHPANRLFRLNMAATALEGGRHSDADALVSDVLSLGFDFDRPAVPGERALWHFVRGAARVALHDGRGANDLHDVLSHAPRDWVRARAHVELATLALRSADTDRARAELKAAEHFGRRGNDQVAIERAGRLRREHRVSG